MNELKITVEHPISNINILEASKLFNEIAFWNINGEEIFRQNKNGTMGNAESQEFANNSGIEDFVLTTLNGELQIFLPSFSVGKSGSHIYISEFSDLHERVILIAF